MAQQRLRKALSNRLPTEAARSWLGHVLDALPADGDADDELIDELRRRVNGSLADEHRHIEEDPEAYVSFWCDVAERLPSHPFARAVYGDTLLLTGDTDAAIEEVLAAFEQDPTVIYRMSGDYADLMQQAGPREWAAYRALAIKAAAIDDMEGNRGYIEDELRELLDELSDEPELRREVLRILKP